MGGMTNLPGAGAMPAQGGISPEMLAMLMKMKGGQQPAPMVPQAPQSQPMTAPEPQPMAQSAQPAPQGFGANMAQMTPFASNPYAGFVNPNPTQRLGGLSPEDWVYGSMMAGMGSPVPGATIPALATTNQLVPGSSTPSMMNPNPYASTLAALIDPTSIPTTPPGTVPPTGLEGDLNGDGTLSKWERKKLKKSTATTTDNTNEHDDRSWTYNYVTG